MFNNGPIEPSNIDFRKAEIIISNLFNTRAAVVTSFVYTNNKIHTPLQHIIESISAYFHHNIPRDPVCWTNRFRDFLPPGANIGKKTLVSRNAPT